MDREEEAKDDERRLALVLLVRLILEEGINVSKLEYSRAKVRNTIRIKNIVQYRARIDA